MKNLSYILCLFALVAMTSCANGPSEDDRSTPVQPNSTSTAAPSATPAATTNPVTPPAASNSDGVFHFTCADGCAGGGAAAGPCAVCGKQLVHNQAYHNTAASTGNPTTTPITTPGAANPIQVSPGAAANQPIQVTPPTAAEPAQNANGVWHFTCANGCAGGGGAVGTCSGCGGALAHNQAYHQ